ncbi:AT-hook motif nuclear-localized protein 10-like [Hordeum vulgare]|nr:AT-hook motif nuclear-localized protein 10-like [Hordeum vulgare]
MSSPPPVAPGVMMPQHAYCAMPPGSAKVMHGKPLAFNPMASRGAWLPAMKPADMPLAFNPMASPGASSPAMKPADMPLAVYRPDSAAPPGMPQPVSDALVVSVSGSGGELVKKKRGRPRKYGPDGTIGSAVKAEAGGQSGGAGSNSNPKGMTNATCWTAVPSATSAHSVQLK